LNENAGAGLCKISSLSAVAPAMGRRRRLASRSKKAELATKIDTFDSYLLVTGHPRRLNY